MIIIETHWRGGHVDTKRLESGTGLQGLCFRSGTDDTVWTGICTQHSFPWTRPGIYRTTVTGGFLEIYEDGGGDGVLPAGEVKKNMFGHHPDPLIDAQAELDKRALQLAEAHAALLRALDYRAATPEGLAIKRDVRDALRRTGYIGEVGGRIEF